jgi:inhibitor of KinA sporulation pathway (predicted exonuclease)
MSKKIKFDNIVVVDLEMSCDGCVSCMKNVCNCSGEIKNYTENVEREIIEIGLCLLNVKSLRRHSRRSIIVKPTTAKITEYCTKLTGITQKEVDEGNSLEDACFVLKKEYSTKKRVWASWGNWDRQQMDLECDLLDIENPMNPRHINIKAQLPILLNLDKELSLSDAVEFLKLEFEGAPHRGSWDAWMEAQILAMIIRGTQ